MTKIKSPILVLPESPMNLDAYIGEMQRKFYSELNWIQWVFGRAWKMYQKRDGMGSSEGIGRGYAYPGAIGPKGEYYNLFPNDEYSAYCFFSARDSAEPATSFDAGSGSYEPGQFNEWRQPVDLIFWYDQDAMKNYFGNTDYPLTETLLAHVRKVLRYISFYSITGVYYNPENIFDGYSLDYVNEQYIAYPYGGFRIAGQIQFLEQDMPGLCNPFPVPIPES